MLNLMIKELENSTSDQLIIELCYIFSLILYNYPEYLETEKGQIIFHKINEIQAKVNS